MKQCEKLYTKTYSVIIYELQGLEHDDALQLFHMKAFKHEQPTDDHVKMSKKIVQYVKGLPLALVLIGSSVW
ncbi:hypothetical protein LWI29_025957 [Acer saccharum]|uniref:Uncharacterized protein n=1 Tax=Acer saccharum TaxID=4024 RepID=A0AA39SQB7_ACESA|nr:hypothetical protein LWI29_025957 [Acer saccharum]